jgi:hypothetical protein
MYDLEIVLGPAAKTPFPRYTKGKDGPVLGKFDANVALVSKEERGAFGGFELAAEAYDLAFR